MTPPNAVVVDPGFLGRVREAAAVPPATTAFALAPRYSSNPRYFSSPPKSSQLSARPSRPVAFNVKAKRLMWNNFRYGGGHSQTGCRMDRSTALPMRYIADRAARNSGHSSRMGSPGKAVSRLRWTCRAEMAKADLIWLAAPLTNSAANSGSERWPLPAC